MVYSSKDFNIVDICHDSAKYASIMAFAAPKVEEPIYLPLHYSHPLLRDSKSMEKDQLISMIHFLVKREDEPTKEASAEPNSFELCIARRRKNIIQRAQENQELKDMVRELMEIAETEVNIGGLALTICRSMKNISSRDAALYMLIMLNIERLM